MVRLKLSEIPGAKELKCARRPASRPGRSKKTKSAAAANSVDLTSMMDTSLGVASPKPKKRGRPTNAERRARMEEEERLRKLMSGELEEEKKEKEVVCVDSGDDDAVALPITPADDKVPSARSSRLGRRHARAAEEEEEEDDDDDDDDNAEEMPALVPLHDDDVEAPTARGRRSAGASASAGGAGAGAGAGPRRGDSRSRNSRAAPAAVECDPVDEACYAGSLPLARWLSDWVQSEPAVVSKKGRKKSSAYACIAHFDDVLESSSDAVLTLMVSDRKRYPEPFPEGAIGPWYEAAADRVLLDSVLCGAMDRILVGACTSTPLRMLLARVPRMCADVDVFGVRRGSCVVPIHGFYLSMQGKRAPVATATSLRRSCSCRTRSASRTSSSARTCRCLSARSGSACSSRSTAPSTTSLRICVPSSRAGSARAARIPLLTAPTSSAWATC